MCIINNHARKIVLTELPHINIGLGNNPIWRVSRKDFEGWCEARKIDPMAYLEEFSQKYM